MIPSLALRAVRAAALPLGVVLTASGLMACGHAPAAEAGGTGGALPAVRVQIAPVERMTLPVTVTATGALAPRPGSFVTLSAPSAARITQVAVALGDHVRPGQALVTFDQVPFTAAFRQSQVARQAAQQAFDRASGLAAQGIVPRREVETARAALAQADAALAVARRSLELATLRSPIAGVVARITAVRDATADPAQPLVQVVDPAALEVRVLLTPGDAARVHPGAPVTVTAGGAGNGGATEALGTGEVIAVGVAVDSLSGGVEARARVTRPTRALRMGEVVRVAIEAGARTDALVVPVAALVPSTAGDGYQVFVVTRGDTARVHPVTVGVRTDSVAQIVRGVSLGDTVVSEGAYGVEDGVRVAPRSRP